ncbi:MAG: arsenate reductase ArsC [Ignavibacteriae bacterium]|nr:arsenate reductase ArsC [Ignavibacteriota bacterium]
MYRASVLFVCIHNSARSQMAEAYLNHFGEEKFRGESAGLEPGVLNPLVVEVMREDGIDISRNIPKGVSQFLSSGRQFTYVITVCDETAAEKCPVFPGKGERIHWDFPDPSSFTGSREERLDRSRQVRDLIKAAVKRFVETTVVEKE